MDYEALVADIRSRGAGGVVCDVGLFYPLRGRRDKWIRIWKWLYEISASTTWM